MRKVKRVRYRPVVLRHMAREALEAPEFVETACGRRIRFREVSLSGGAHDANVTEDPHWVTCLACRRSKVLANPGGFAAFFDGRVGPLSRRLADQLDSERRALLALGIDIDTVWHPND